ncbi:hypothetical protein K438DRAFT_57955 [Mycena galopus ATCC 62051]|nr:hypothetical protein K438DRAFT_57955 [Mycena galopus ATCC 62051]
MESNQALRDRLAEIDAHIALLERERQGIRTTLDSLTYPVLSLPFEVTSKIFIQCLPDIQHPEPVFNVRRHRYLPAPLPSPVLLVRICRAWRDVALNTPKLWAEFRISVEDWPDYTAGTLRLAEWIERAARSPLSFIFRRPKLHNVPAYTLDPLVRHSMQWKTVDFCLPFQDLVQLGVHGRLPSLGMLQLELFGNAGPTALSTFEDAPNLRTVVLRHLPPTTILLPWAQLTHFTGERYEGPECLHVLRSAVSLVSCKFTDVDDDLNNSNIPLPPHHALEALHLTGQLVCLDILSILTLPALLELDFTDVVGFEFDEKFVEFFSRSRPPLHRLSLSRGYKCLVHCSQFLLHLTVLEINDLREQDLPHLLHHLRSGLNPSPLLFFIAYLATLASWPLGIHSQHA